MGQKTRMPVGMTGDLVADRYRIDKRLGAGGMATVFLAKDCRLERDVAIKRLHAHSPEDVGQRFQREAKVGASLNHPNIVGVYDTVTDDEGVLIVMEYVAGHTLREEIARGPMDPTRAIEILSSVAAALDHAHEHGVVHRDVKPANVLVDEERDIVKLADLGIATAAENTRITHSGNVLGTAAYMAPERLDGGAGEPSVDIYALAAVAFEMLSGRKAIEGATPLEIARRVATQPPPDLREYVADAPAEAADALNRGLAKRPEERQRTAGDLVRELAAAYASQAQERRTRSTALLAEQRPREEERPSNGHAAAAVAPPPRAPEQPAPRVHRGSRRPRWLVPAALAAGVIALLAVLVVALSSGDGSSQEDTTAGSGGDTAQQEEPQGSSESGAAEQPGSGDSAAPAPEEPSSSAGGELTPATPDGAVSTFYTAAANDDYDAAWQLATQNLQNQLQGYESFASSQSTLESIEFPKLKVSQETGDTATVDFKSIATHDSYTDRCTGSVALVRQGETWMLDQLQAVNCKTG
jgi:serine/threonine-protein kinase